jgi:hypothetical protein
MPTPGDQKLTESPELSYRVRRLRWFRQSFHDAADEVGRRFHFAYAVDDRLLVDAFFRWARDFERERESSDLNRKDFAIFAAGLMLRELLNFHPAQKVGAGQFDNLIPAEPMAKICEFWPEGYLYTSYCRTLLQAILQKEYEVTVLDPPELHDLRVWQSFRENFRENPALATAFFDVFMGVKPNWDFPERFLSRPGAKAGALSAPGKT